MEGYAHVGASVPQIRFASDTHYPWLVEGADIIAGPNLSMRDGEMAVPRAPGVGVDLDRDKLARANEVYRKCGMRRRNDERTMRMLEPGWRRSPF